MKIKIIKKNEDGYNPEADCRICFEYNLQQVILNLKFVNVKIH